MFFIDLKIIRKNTDYYKYEKRISAPVPVKKELAKIYKKDDNKLPDPKPDDIPNPNLKYFMDFRERYEKAQKEKNNIDSTSKKADKPRLKDTKRSKTPQPDKKRKDGRRSKPKDKKKPKSVDKKDRDVPKAQDKDQDQFKKMNMAKPIIKKKY